MSDGAKCRRESWGCGQGCSFTEIDREGLTEEVLFEGGAGMCYTESGKSVQEAEGSRCSGRRREETAGGPCGCRAGSPGRQQSRKQRGL